MTREANVPLRAWRATWLAVCLAAPLAPAATLAAAPEPYVIPVVLPLTGNAAFLGQGEQKALAVLQSVVNRQGGIAGQPLRFDFRDDESSPQQAVQLTQGAIAAHANIIIGSALVAMCNAMMPLVREGPVIYCLSPATHPPPGSYMFSANVSTTDLLAALMHYARARGWTRIAALSSSDATGQDFEHNADLALKLPDNAALHFVAHERFNLGDVSVAAQLERIAAAKPQLLVAWTTGGALATILKGVVQSGLEVPLATSQGNQTFAQMDQYKDFLPATLLLPSSEFEPHQGRLDLGPRVEAAQALFYGEMHAAGRPIDVVAAHAWDPGMILVEALRKLGTSASPAQIRDYIDGLRDWAGVNGIYDFRQTPQRGLSLADAVVTRWDVGSRNWDIVSAPGGQPLQ